jgi:hypothetical protein
MLEGDERMEVKSLGFHDIDDLNYLAEEVLLELRHNVYLYDEEGNGLRFLITSEERFSKLKEFQGEISNNYLEFKGNETLKNISFSDALWMELSVIKEKYLKDILKEARRMMRKDSMLDFMIVSDEVDDEYLDNLLAIRWRENLKLWTMQWNFEENLAEKFIAEDENKQYTNFQKAEELIKSDDRLSNSPIPKRIGNSNTWVVKTKFQTEIGDLDYIASEFVTGGVIYRFHNYHADGKEMHHDHEHSIIGVLHAIMNNPEGFSLDGFEDDYSQQEMVFLNAVRDKLLLIEK